MSRLRVATLANTLRTRGLVVEEHGAFRCAARVIAAVVGTEASTVWRRETHRALADAFPLFAGDDAPPAQFAAVASHARLADAAPALSDDALPPSLTPLPATLPFPDLASSVPAR